MTAPGYYTRLGPFLDLFRTGAPVLMYHHVGPRPRGVRLKGLYVSPELFSRQMAELRAAGFCTPEFGQIHSPSIELDGNPSPRPLPVGWGEGGGRLEGFRGSTREIPSGSSLPNPQVFLTIDDGFRDVFEYALPVLRENGFHAILYLVSDLIGKTNEWQQKMGDVVEPLMDDAHIRAWLEAGHEIGAHTQTHPRLTQLSVAAAREEITASKKSLEDRFGLRIDHFCYPYGDWNASVRDLVVSAGYKTACTTDAGVNTGKTSPFELKRFMARYRSLNLRTLWRGFRGSLSPALLGQLC